MESWNNSIRRFCLVFTLLGIVVYLLPVHHPSHAAEACVFFSDGKTFNVPCFYAELNEGCSFSEIATPTATCNPASLALTLTNTLSASPTNQIFTYDGILSADVEFLIEDGEVGDSARFERATLQYEVTLESEWNFTDEFAFLAQSGVLLDLNLIPSTLPCGATLAKIPRVQDVQFRDLTVRDNERRLFDLGGNTGLDLQIDFSNSGEQAELQCSAADGFTRKVLAPFAFIDMGKGLSATPPASTPEPTPTPTDPDPTDTPGVSIGGDTSAGTLGDPISTFTGELFSRAPADFNLGGPMPLRFSRYYAAFLAKDAKMTSALGTNWLHTFDWVLNFSGESIEVVNHQGRGIRFEDTDPSGTEGVWNLIGNTRIPFQLGRSSSDQFILADPSTKRLYTFEAPPVSGETGKLVTIEDGKGNTHTLSYDANAKLTDVDDGLGRTLMFTYDANAKLASVSDGTRTVTFGHTGDDLTGVTNALGNETTFTYAAGGLMTTTTRPEGNTPFTQTFDGEGRALTQTDANGNTHTLAYADADTIATDPLGQTQTHTHSTNGEVTDNQDEDGNTFVMGYDGTGRRNAITDRLGDTTAFTYHAPSGNIASVANADGTITNSFYTDRPLDSGLTLFDRTEVVFPDGTTQEMAYDAQGNLIAFTDQAGNESTFTYNDRGQPLTATNTAGGVVTQTYNADGTRASRTDASGNTTTFAYDPLKRLITITHADGTTRAFTYDNTDNLLTDTDELGNTTTLAYDDNNNLTAITDALGQATTMAYDGQDRVTTVTDPLDNNTARTYDELGRLKTVTDRTANTTTVDYDARGRLTSVTDGEGHVWPRTHDLESILASMADPLAHTATFTSDEMGRITSVVSPLGNMTDLTYDTLGRVTDVTNPLGDTTTSTYDARGLLARSAMADGVITAAFDRNALGQLTTLTDPNGHDWLRAFDPQGRLTSRTDPLGNNTTFDYDTRNRVARVTLPESTLDLTYDATGNVIRRLFSDGTDLTFDFDPLNRLTTANNVSLAYDDNGQISNSNGIAITRDANGRIASMTLAPGKTVTYSYDRRRLLTQVTDWLGGTTTFSYDAAAQLIEITRPNGITTTMTYDQDGQVTSIVEGSLSSIALTRDAHGQITGSAHNVPLSPVVPQGAITDQSYDAASQVTGFSYDALGRLTTDGARTYTWDLASRLTSVNDGVTVTFAYDGLGTRISRTDGSTTRDYVVNYALGLPSVSVVREGGADLRYYIHTPGGGLLYSIEARDESRRDYHYDAMGNTLFLTDASGTVITSYAYSPYGAILDTTGSVENPFTWQGRLGVMQEGTSGLYSIRARYYDSATGRFISRDPMRSIGPKSINPYQYALANPMRFVDPTGNRSISQKIARGATRFLESVFFTFFNAYSDALFVFFSSTASFADERIVALPTGPFGVPILDLQTTHETALKAKPPLHAAFNTRTLAIVSADLHAAFNTRTLTIVSADEVKDSGDDNSMDSVVDDLRTKAELARLRRFAISNRFSDAMIAENEARARDRTPIGISALAEFLSRAEAGPQNNREAPEKMMPNINNAADDQGDNSIDTVVNELPNIIVLD